MSQEKEHYCRGEHLKRRRQRGSKKKIRAKYRIDKDHVLHSNEPTTFQASVTEFLKIPNTTTRLCSKCENVRLAQKCGTEYRHVFTSAYQSFESSRRVTAQFSELMLPTTSFNRSEETTVPELLQCGRKSDLLRKLCCDRSVDSLNRTCLGHSTRPCPKCEKGKKLYRNPDIELACWGPLEDPKVKIKWRSYVDDDDKNTSDIHCHEGHPSLFLNHMMSTLEVYKHHYLTCKKQKQSHQELERNVMPWQLLIDVDFAENFTIIMGREIQSQHWITKMVTLFIGITQHLCRARWDDVSGKLDRGSEVSVDNGGGEMYWGECKDDSVAGAQTVVCVVDSKGVEKMVLRSKVHPRKLVNTAHITVSDDKGHDTEFV